MVRGGKGRGEGWGMVRDGGGAARQGLRAGLRMRARARVRASARGWVSGARAGLRGGCSSPSSCASAPAPPPYSSRSSCSSHSERSWEARGEGGAWEARGRRVGASSWHRRDRSHPTHPGCNPHAREEVVGRVCILWACGCTRAWKKRDSCAPCSPAPPNRRSDAHTLRGSVCTQRAVRGRLSKKGVTASAPPAAPRP